MEEKAWLRPTSKLVISYKSNQGENKAVTTMYACNCSDNPPLIMAGIRANSYCCQEIKVRGEFVVNLVSKELKDIYDKLPTNELNELNLEVVEAAKVTAPILEEFPINFECRVVDSLTTGSHKMFVARIENLHVNRELITEEGGIDFSKIDFL